MGSASYQYSIEELSEIVAPIARKYKVGRIYLFGSRARGDNSEDSDFDFCIDSKNMEGLMKMCGFLCDLEDALGGSVDIVSEGYISDGFAKEVRRDGKLIYES